MAWQPIQSGGRPIFSVKSGSPIPQADAQKVGEYIQDLESKNEITPQSLVEDACKKASVLHKFFDWDDKIAGEKWRLQTARVIINHFEVVVVNPQTEEEMTTRAWHSVQVEHKNNGSTKERVYAGVVRVISDNDLRQQVIDNALREAQNWRKRYSTYSELQLIFAVIDEVVKSKN